MSMLTLMDYKALNLVLVEGESPAEAARQSYLSGSRVRGLLKREDVREMMQEVQQEALAELKLLWKKVIGKLREALDSKNEMVVQQAIDKFLRTQGMYKEVVEARLSAEDVARELMREAVKVGAKAAKVGMEKSSEPEMDVFDEETLH